MRKKILLTLRTKNKKTKKIRKKERAKMEKDAQRIIDEEMQSDGTGKEEKFGEQK